MCFDICTINIRVSIRVRGLHLVSCLRCPQEDADAGIAFVQTSAQLISAGNAMSVDATGAVAEHRGSRGGSPAAALDSQVMSVSADGRMHVEM